MPSLCGCNNVGGCGEIDTPYVPLHCHIDERKRHFWISPSYLDLLPILLKTAWPSRNSALCCFSMYTKVVLDWNHEAGITYFETQSDSSPYLVSL